MKVWYLTDSPIPSRTANSIQSMRMCDAIRRRGHRVALCCHATGVHTEEEIFAYYGVSTQFSLCLQGDNTPSSFRNFFNSEKRTFLPEVIFSRSPTGLHEALFSGYADHGEIIYEAHVPPQSDRERDTFLALFQSPRFRQLICISSALAEEYENQFSLLRSSERVTVVHSGAHLVPEGSAEPYLLPGRIGVPRVGYTGNLYPGKGGDLVFELARHRPEIDFHIIGGMDDDIARLNSREGLPNLHIHGFVAPCNIPRAQAALDVLLLPYQRRVLGFGSQANLAPWMSPLKMFESLAAGKPIIASRLDVLEEVLSCGETALLVNPDDIGDWLGAIDRLVSDIALQSSLGKSARTLAAAFTLDARVQTIFEMPRHVSSAEIDVA